MLAGPSNSGVEPQSLTGTGSGLHVEDAGRKSKRARMDPSPIPSSPAHLEAKDEPRAKELIAVLEKLFEDSIDLPFEAPRSRNPTLASQNGTNEAYLGHLLENDDLSGGWTFLNLVCTMAQIHRFSVTIPFVRSAVISYSSKLEISPDGKKIRWIGPSPQYSPAYGRKHDSVAPPLSRSPSSTRSSSISGLTTSSSESATHISGSGEGSAEASTAATSVAPHPSDILHKARLAPTPLQPRASAPSTSAAGSGAVTEETSSKSELLSKASTTSEPWAKRYIPCPYRSRDGAVSPLPSAPNESSSTEQEPATATTGMLVFYADASFCSDFSKCRLSTSTLPGRPSPLKLLGSSLGAETEDGDSAASFSHPPISSLDLVDDLAIIYGEQGTVMHSTSPSSADSTVAQAEEAQDIDRFRTATGMTDTTMADLFMMVVLTRLSTAPPLSDASSSEPKAASAFDSTDLAAFPVKQTRLHQSVVSSNLVYHSPRVTPRRPILLHTLSSDDGTLSSESTTSSDSPRLVSVTFARLARP
jgi:hypothetical protein